MSIQFPNLGINLDYVGKSIHIFGFEITFFGLIVALGMLLGLGFVMLEAKRCGEDQDRYLGMFIVSLITGVIGARLYYVAFSWNTYKDNVSQIFNIRNGGLAFYGALLGGVIGAAIFCAIRKASFVRMADTASIGIVIGQIIGRWGDFFNRESFGEYTNNIFAMQLPLSAVRSREVTVTMRENLETIGGVSYIQAHPVFLYESMWCLLLLLLMLVWKRKKRFHGEVFLRYLAGYGLGRFFFEYLRTDKLLIPGTNVGISQVVSAALFLICTVVAMVKGSMAKKRAALRKRRREQDYEAQERAAREAEAEEYRDRLRLERAFAEGNPDFTGSMEAFQKKSMESVPEENSAASDAEDENAAMEAADPQEPGSHENAELQDTPEEAVQEAAQDLPSQEENIPAVDEKETQDASAPADPFSSKEDEWLYSKPRRFAKKPENQQKD